MFKFKKSKDNRQNLALPQLSLCGHLEADFGQYILYGAGCSDIETLYYDAEGFYDDIKMTKENIAAFFVNNESLAFVRRDMLSKLQRDTEGYHIYFVPFDSFTEEYLSQKDLRQVPGFNNYLEKITWIDDDFMNDENIEFDFAAFEIIDSGAEYLNPNHFSLEQLISTLKALEF